MGPALPPPGLLASIHSSGSPHPPFIFKSSLWCLFMIPKSITLRNDLKHLIPLENGKEEGVGKGRAGVGKGCEA